VFQSKLVESLGGWREARHQAIHYKPRHPVFKNQFEFRYLWRDFPFLSLPQKKFIKANTIYKISFQIVPQKQSSTLPNTSHFFNTTSTKPHIFSTDYLLLCNSIHN